MEKRTVLFLALILFVINAYSQDLPCKEKYYSGRCKERYREDADGNIHGKRIYYNENGSVVKVENYSHGNLHGLVTENFDWGKSITTYVNGTAQGLYQDVLKNGVVETQGNYVNGDAQGYWVEGLNKGSYNKGKKQGYWIEDDGKSKGSYINGIRTGSWELSREGFGNTKAGITKGNFINGELNGTWTNFVVTSCDLYDYYCSKGLKIRSPEGIKSNDQHYSIKYFYKQGYKAVFENGVYIKGIDPNGNDLGQKERAKEDSIRIVQEEKELESNPNLALRFKADSYELENPSLFDLFIKKTVKKVNQEKSVPVRITIVGHTNKLGNPDEEDAKTYYIVSLNRATVVYNKIKHYLNKTDIIYEHYGVGYSDVDGYSYNQQGAIEIFINQDSNTSKAIFEGLKNTYNVSDSDSIIINIGLLKNFLWNIYMKSYGVEAKDILPNVPPELHNNVHVKKAIAELPAYMNRIDNKTLDIPLYKGAIKNQLEQITKDNFNTL